MGRKVVSALPPRGPEAKGTPPPCSPMPGGTVFATGEATRRQLNGRATVLRQPGARGSTGGQPGAAAVIASVHRAAAAAGDHVAAARVRRSAAIITGRQPGAKESTGGQPGAAAVAASVHRVPVVARVHRAAAAAGGYVTTRYRWRRSSFHRQSRSRTHQPSQGSSCQRRRHEYCFPTRILVYPTGTPVCSLADLRVCQHAAAAAARPHAVAATYAPGRLYYYSRCGNPDRRARTTAQPPPLYRQAASALFAAVSVAPPRCQ